MKKYTSLGMFLIDFRAHKNMSQADFAAKLEVDIRTIIRWEKNQTLLKPEKEEALVDIAFVPYQVIRNLNAPVAIHTFYDFTLRKYSLSLMSNDIPEANWLKDKISISTDRLRTIQYDSDIKNALQCICLQPHIKKPIGIDVIKKALRLLPELNLIIFDNSNYYSGHSVFLPLSMECYNRLKKREIREEAITVNDLVDYKQLNNPVFYAYDINSDCNENIFYIASKLMRFFMHIKREYLYGAFISRLDSYSLNTQMGIRIVWQDDEQQLPDGSIYLPRFYEGSFAEFLNT
ncbi:helix-turn-helix domain-containing protein [Bizionia hallyeonensis]|uniref:Helix-turn-helix domain-containing protein n=1 Tax=Bizionia hallyeonensis TaxID=1123757 RepID=A0ABW0C4M8_9FLAO